MRIRVMARCLRTSLRAALGLVLLAGLGPLVPPSDAQTIDEIVARHIAARGGLERWQAIRSLRMTGRVIAGPGREALVVREIKRPNRVRTEFTFQGITGVYAYDGARGWQVSPLTGVVEPQALEPENTQAALEQADIEGLLVSGAKKGYTMTLVGRETIAGREAYRIRLTPKTGQPLEQYLDAETGLLLRTDTTRRFRGHAVQLETTFGEYRAIGGLMFPHAIEFGARGRPGRVQIVVETVELNPVIDDARFRRPAGMRR
jgi:outer membrane lipoprotein-sorting protein